MTDEPKRPDGEEILNLPLAQETEDGQRTIRGYLSEVLWTTWNHKRTAVYPIGYQRWRETMCEALSAAGYDPESTAADGQDLVSAAIWALSEPAQTVTMDDIHDGDTILATVQGYARHGRGRSAGIYLAPTPDTPMGDATAWISDALHGEPVALQRIKAVPHGVPRPLLRDALEALRAADPGRSAEIDAARVHIDQTLI